VIRSHWKIWFDANRVEGAEKVLRQVIDLLGVDALDTVIEPYQKGGHLGRFMVSHEAGSWSDIVVTVIALGERLGSGWQLSGAITEDPSGWLAREHGDFRISGVTNVEWSLARDEAG